MKSQMVKRGFLHPRRVQSRPPKGDPAEGHRAHRRYRPHLTDWRVVLDTNVLVSAVLFPKSRIGMLVQLAKAGVLKQSVSPAILDEFLRVLMSPKIGYQPERVDEALAAVREVATLVHPKMRVRVVKDHDADNRILECALEGMAAFLVTGDLRHIRPLDPFRGIRVRTPHEFMDEHFPRGAGLPKS